MTLYTSESQHSATGLGLVGSGVPSGGRAWLMNLNHQPPGQAVLKFIIIDNQILTLLLSKVTRRRLRK